MAMDTLPLIISLSTDYTDCTEFLAGEIFSREGAAQPTGMLARARKVAKIFVCTRMPQIASRS